MNVNNNMGMGMGMVGNRGPMGNYSGTTMQARRIGPSQNPMMMMQQSTQMMSHPDNNMLTQNMAYNNQCFGDGYGQGVPMGGMAFDQAIRTPEACLVPPPPGMPPRSCRERPAGCRTVFVGGLPDNCTEYCLRDIFMHMGNVVSCRLSKKNFAHIRFELEESADYAVKFSGWMLCIGDSEDPNQNQARIHVDYAMARDDQAEYDERQKQYYRELRNQMLGDEDLDTVVQYSDHEASLLQEQLRANDSFSAATQILLTWLERGDCTRRNSSAFYSMTQTAHSHVRRMAAEKQQFVQEFNSMKERFKLQLQTILRQFEQIEKVFVAAQKQKVWDHFTKAQRKNMTAWHAAVQEAKKENVEFALNQRQEDEMELSDQDDDDGSAPQQKKPRIETKNSDIQDALNKLQEENDELKCRLEASINEVETTREEMDKDNLQNDSIVAFLKTALHNTQRQLLDSKKQIQKLEAQLRAQKGESAQDNESVVDEAKTMEDRPEFVPKEEETSEKTVEITSDDVVVDECEPIDEVEMDLTSGKCESSPSPTPVAKEDTQSETAAEADENSQSGTDSEKLPETSDSKAADIDESTDSLTAVESAETKAENEETKEAKPMSEMDKLIAEAMRYASTEKTHAAVPPKGRPSRSSGFKDSELKIVGLLSMFLNLHPYGATSEYICSYLNHLNFNVTPTDVDILLLKLPMLFYEDRREVDDGGYQSLWCFQGFNNRW